VHQQTSTNCIALGQDISQENLQGAAEMPRWSGCCKIDPRSWGLAGAVVVDPLYTNQIPMVAMAHHMAHGILTKLSSAHKHFAINQVAFKNPKTIHVHNQ
jgi:hypothetical protein